MADGKLSPRPRIIRQLMPLAPSELVPVIVISLGDFEELIKAARRPRSLADMVRSGRPPIAAPLVIREGAPASERFEL